MAANCSRVGRSAIAQLISADERQQDETSSGSVTPVGGKDAAIGDVTCRRPEAPDGPGDGSQDDSDRGQDIGTGADEGAPHQRKVVGPCHERVPTEDDDRGAEQDGTEDREVYHSFLLTTRRETSTRPLKMARKTSALVGPLVTVPCNSQTTNAAMTAAMGGSMSNRFIATPSSTVAARSAHRLP